LESLSISDWNMGRSGDSVVSYDSPVRTVHCKRADEESGKRGEKKPLGRGRPRKPITDLKPSSLRRYGPDVTEDARNKISQERRLTYANEMLEQTQDLHNEGRISEEKYNARVQRLTAIKTDATASLALFPKAQQDPGSHVGSTSETPHSPTSETPHSPTSETPHSPISETPHSPISETPHSPILLGWNNHGPHENPRRDPSLDQIHRFGPAYVWQPTVTRPATPALRPHVVDHHIRLPVHRDDRSASP